MSVEENKRVVERFMDRIVLGRDMDAVDELCASDVVYRMPVGVAYGRSGLKAMFTKTFGAFPDCRILPEFHVAERDHVITRATMRATLTGAFEDRSPTGRKLVLPQVWDFRLADAVIADIHVSYDTRLLMDLLGIPPTRAVEY